MTKRSDERDAVRYLFTCADMLRADGKPTIANRLRNVAISFSGLRRERTEAERSAANKAQAAALAGESIRERDKTINRLRQERDAWCKLAGRYCHERDDALARLSDIRVSSGKSVKRDSAKSGKPSHLLVRCRKLAKMCRELRETVRLVSKSRDIFRKHYNNEVIAHGRTSLRLKAVRAELAKLIESTK